MLWLLGSAHQDPYIKASLELQGAVDHGGQLFRTIALDVTALPAKGW